jgi:hypothetical protein
MLSLAVRSLNGTGEMSAYWANISPVEGSSIGILDEGYFYDLLLLLRLLTDRHCLVSLCLTPTWNTLL